MESEINNYIDELLRYDDNAYEYTDNICSKLDVISEKLSMINSENVKFKKSLNKQTEIINNVIKKNNSINTLLNIVDEVKLNERIQKEREERLIHGIINILDSIDWLLNNPNLLNNESIEGSITASKKIIKRELDDMKISDIAKVGDIFNERLHTCIGYQGNKELVDDQILAVIKNGYTFRDQVVRLAEVIVVKNGGGH